MARKTSGILLIGAAVIGTAVLYGVWRPQASRPEDILAAYQEDAGYAATTVEYPLDGTVFPPEMVPPVFRWKDSVPGARAWLVSITCADGESALCFLARRPHWCPEPADWESLKRRSLERNSQVVILGVGWGRPPRILSRGRLSFRTSQDAVGAPLFYREVNLPFLDADKDPSHIRWRFGSIATRQPPAVVLKKMPVCANCHSFSRDGTLLAMDVDYADRKASYVVTRVRAEMALTMDDIITWSDADNNEDTFGLLSQISPDGRWIVFCRARSYMLLQPDSELYIIPAEGGPARRLRCNTARMNSWHSWSPNGKWLVFSSKAYSDYTQLCLTHIDENGESTPPVLLSHLTAPSRAANIPEFVNAPPDAIAHIRAQFLKSR